MYKRQVLSLFNYDLLNPPKFVGLGNFRYLLHDSCLLYTSILPQTDDISKASRTLLAY